ncbi:MAG: mechanosensitive ion channel [Muribaculaceae bacterium]|nr:mechanosensitive ion channel [Muribaculaceae bacterium]
MFLIPHDNAEAIANETTSVPVTDGTGTEHYWGIAKFLMRVTYDFLSLFHLEQHRELFVFVYAILVFIISFGIGLLLQWIIVKMGKKLQNRTSNDIYTNLVRDRFFTRICRLIPAILFLIFIQFTLGAHATLSDWLTRITISYMVILVAVALCSLADVTWIHIDNRENKKKLPLKGIVSLTKGIIWIVALIIVVALLVNKSPGTLLAGLGAFAAVLMLVFKDSILGVVAGVQLSENDSLHVGDWIKVGDANGTVMEVTLTQVKVLNWDKTTTTVPPYSLVSGGFTNYRTMQESGTRRVERSYLIDADSVVATTEAMLDEFAKIPLLTEWIQKKREQKAAGKVEDVFNSAGLVDGSIETNLGVFRAYLALYLSKHPNVDQGEDGTTIHFVTTLPQTSAGIPLQLYFFTSTSQWAQYEAIGASIFEHIAVMLYRFRLYTFEYPTGRDTLLEGYLSPGKPPQAVFGLPEGMLPSEAPKGDVPGSQAPPIVETPPSSGDILS